MLLSQLLTCLDSSVIAELKELQFDRTVWESLDAKSFGHRPDPRCD